MVKRRKEEEVAGVLEFAGRSETDPEFVGWLAEHRASNGGKLRMSLGGTGVRVMFARQADMELWRQRCERADRAKKASGG